MQIRNRKLLFSTRSLSVYQSGKTAHSAQHSTISWGSIEYSTMAIFWNPSWKNRNDYDLFRCVMMYFQVKRYTRKSNHARKGVWNGTNRLIRNTWIELGCFISYIVSCSGRIGRSRIRVRGVKGQLWIRNRIQNPSA